MDSNEETSPISVIRSPNDSGMATLCDYLSRLASDAFNHWPADSLNACAQAGVFAWFMDPDDGGFGWNETEQTRGYLALSAADITTTFVITQRMGACRRIAGSGNETLKKRWLGPLIKGDAFATVGISHLTTSRRHLGKPVLHAERDGDEFLLNSYSPWVTGGAHADVIVVGATLADGRQLLAAVPTHRDGVDAQPGSSLVALSGSCTDRVELTNVRIGSEDLIAGPVDDVMTTGTGGATGGLQTSTLAIGLSKAAIDFLGTEAARREDLRAAADQLLAEYREVESNLLELASGQPVCSTAELRGQANRLVLRSSQAALTAAKGAGFLEGHPAGRWCREALFFLVWSCPQPVAQAHLCELAGIEE